MKNGGSDGGASHRRPPPPLSLLTRSPPPPIGGIKGRREVPCNALALEFLLPRRHTMMPGFSVRGVFHLLGPLPINQCVVAVVHSAVCAARQQLRNLAPLVPEPCLGAEQNGVFIRGPRRFFYIRVEVVHPPLPAILPAPPWDAFRNCRTRKTLFLDQPPQQSVFLTRPMRGRTWSGCNPTRWKNHVCSKFRSFVKFPRGGLLECTGRARECWEEGGIKPQREVVEKGMEGRK